jgi:hypothetical protein
MSASDRIWVKETQLCDQKVTRSLAVLQEPVKRRVRVREHIAHRVIGKRNGPGIRTFAVPVSGRHGHSGFDLEVLPVSFNNTLGFTGNFGLFPKVTKSNQKEKGGRIEVVSKETTFVKKTRPEPPE